MPRDEDKLTASKAGSASSSHREQVLSALADLVDAMDSSSAIEADLLELIVDGHRAYVTRARDLLREDVEKRVRETPHNAGSELPRVDNSADASIEGGQTGNTDLGATGEALVSQVRSLADRGQSRAEELDAVRKKEIEEKGGGGTTTGGTTTSGGTTTAGGTTTTGGSTTGGGGTTPGDPTTPTGPGETPDPVETPPENPPVVVRRKKTKRRCYKFTLLNTGRRPISDLHFQGGGPAASISAPTEGGWQARPTADGFEFSTADPRGFLPPGRKLGPFEFCLERPMTSDIFLTHPSGPPSRLGPGDALIGGRPAPIDENGNARIPANGREWVYELTFNTGGSDQAHEIRLSDPTANSQQLPGQVTVGDVENGGFFVHSNQAGQEVTVSFSSEHPHVSASIYTTDASANPVPVNWD